MSPLAIGLGCRHGCPADALKAAIEAACAGLDRAGACLFTIERKRGEASLTEAARRLGLPIRYLDETQLRLALPAVETRSARVEAAVNVPSVAEAAALAGAGAGARLIVPRRVLGGVTCAVARGAS